MSLQIDIASLSAEWAAVAVTMVGLSSLVLQLNSFQNLLDKFRSHRGSDWLGPWAKHEKSATLLPSKLGSPRGPHIDGTYIHGFCGLHDLHVSRKPAGRTGKASWTSILATFHPNPLPVTRRSVTSLTASQKADDLLWEGIVITEVDRKPWEQRLPLHELVIHREKVCTKITRTAFIICLVVTNSYQLYKYSDASGLRAAYSGYSGMWQVHWPLGGFAEMEFFPLDSHDEGQEKHPPSFRRRVDKCILMLIGMLECDELGKLAFPEPKARGASVLVLLKKGFAANGKPSHLLNMMGGNPYEVDYLARQTLHENEEAAHTHEVKLMIPTPELDLNRKPVKPWEKGQQYSNVYVPLAEEKILATALDCLPWSSLGWSVHRGMQCLLVAYGERIMSAYRPAFAYTLKMAIKTHASVLERQGWSPSIVRDHMPDNAATSIMEVGGDSGDSVRIVTAAARLLNDKPDQELDETHFWRSFVGKPAPTELPETEPLGDDAIIALTNLFVLEWSNELDHKLYEDLPLHMLVA